MARSSFKVSSTAEAVATAFKEQAAGRSFLITGAAGGLGQETARVLAAAGGDVFIAARSEASAAKAIEKIRKDLDAVTAGSGAAARLSPLAIDLSSLKSVAAGAETYIKRSGGRLHCLICNAGVMAPPYSTTAEGLESQFGVNHVGHFLLAEKLRPALAAAGTPERPSRVVCLASTGQWLLAPKKGIDFGSLADANKYDAWPRYGESKLANLVFASGMITGTGLMRSAGLFSMLRYMSILIGKGEGRFFYGLGLSSDNPNKTIPQGAATSVFAALAPELEGGAYYHNCQVETKHVHPLAQSEELGKKLWEYSEEVLEQHNLLGA